ncbi:MAG: hypothetical protein L6V93_07205 [Clostridiales bacterium]|nr:MAG: hypothetical protein L6V93_07205 [Clostridiales bacterium]
MFDYINSITIGSIAAEMATDEVPDFLTRLLQWWFTPSWSWLSPILRTNRLQCAGFFHGKVADFCMTTARCTVRISQNPSLTSTNF